MMVKSTDFRGKKPSKKDSHCTCLTGIVLDSMCKTKELEMINITHRFI